MPGYYCLRLDETSRKALLTALPPEHEHVIAEHVTLALGSEVDGEAEAALKAALGQTFTLPVIQNLVDHQGQVAILDGKILGGLMAPGRVAHVTLSLKEWVKPSYGKQMAAAWGMVPFQKPLMLITGTVVEVR